MAFSIQPTIRAHAANIPSLTNVKTSAITLNIDKEKISGTYRPLNRLSPNADGTYAHATKFIGDIRIEVVIRGTYEHDVAWDGEAKTGTFEMRSPGDKFDKDFNGSWTQDGSQTKHPWKWSLEQEGRQEKFTDSVWMDRYGVWCGWAFFILTAAQLVSVVTEWKGNARLNQMGNFFFSLCYMAFLAVYCFTTNKPPWKYALGVLLYTVGYIVFAAIYSEAPEPEALYHLGSWLFLIGSVFLMSATYPSKLKHYAPHLIEAELFWGSTMFFIGSACFAYDALGFGDLFGESLSNVQLGLATFVVGRLFFLRGSCTWRCTATFDHAKTLSIGKSVPGLDCELAAPLMSRGKHITEKLNQEILSKIAAAHPENHDDDATTTVSETDESESKGFSTDEEESRPVSEMQPAEEKQRGSLVSRASLKSVSFEHEYVLRDSYMSTFVGDAANDAAPERDSVLRGSYMSTFVGDSANDAALERDSVVLEVMEI